jgi:ATP-dependent helicase/nuclease subunit B
MSLAGRLSVGAEVRGPDLWPTVARRVTLELQRHGRSLRDCIVLVPYAALIEPLRAAFAAQPGWQPRVETARTLAATLGPGVESEPGLFSGDAALDRLQASRWLGPPLQGPIDRSHAALLLADASAALARGAAQQAPAARAAWWSTARDHVGGAPEGGGAFEAGLLRAAVAWAETAAPPLTDRLFELQPSAWFVVGIGGPDPLAQAVLAASRCGGWWVDLDPAADEPFRPWADVTLPTLRVADDFESEAQAAATEVLQALQRADARVGLVALDRVLVRRVTALLQRAGVEVDDETGWKLSTTAPAGRVLARLHAAAASADGDDRLDWLKRWRPAQGRAEALRALERRWRDGRNARLSPLERDAAERLRADAERTLSAWALPLERSLDAWLDLLRQQLIDEGEWDRLADDVAGAALLAALQPDWRSPAWQSVLNETRCTLDGLTTWFESWCETQTVQHVPRPGSRVVLTPLARAVGRPFSHVVVAGADARHLGRAGDGPALISDAWAGLLGLETAAQRRLRQRLAFAQLLRVPQLTLSWRRQDGDTPLSPAPEVEWLQADWQAAGHTLRAQPVSLIRARVPAQPAHRPGPDAEDLLPPALSASAVDALRQCPYRFFSRSVLQLTDVEELDQPLRKRDYGDWLHASLHHFHLHRLPNLNDEQELLALQQAADHAMAELELDAAALLPFRASLLAVLPAYLTWLRAREADGWRWQAGEDALTAAPPEWAPQILRGRIDRIDADAQGRRCVIDYKTGAASGLRTRLNDPLEDTQLAFYVALLQGQATGQDGDETGARGEAVEVPGSPETPEGPKLGGSPPVEAAYLALDERDGPRLLVHPDVDHTARELIAHVGAELHRLRQGAAMPALGEGSVCDTCEARGLCRRDEWPPTEAAA